MLWMFLRFSLFQSIKMDENDAASVTILDIVQERMFTMLSVKRITALLVMTVTLMFGSLPAMAADLSVKENKTRAGITNVTVPYISGAEGGKQIDLLVNRTVLSAVNAELKNILSESEVKDFDASHKDEPELSDALRYNSDLVKYTDKMIAGKTATGRSAASWYVRSEYEVKAARSTFFSVVLKIRTYTGGPSDKVIWKAMNFDLKDGRQLALKDLFEAEADYASRLRTLIGYQQQGRARLIRHIKGKNVADPVPVTITGQESFYVDDHYNLGIILNSGETGSASAKNEAAVTESGEISTDNEKAESNAVPEGNVKSGAEIQAAPVVTEGTGNEPGTTVVNNEPATESSAAVTDKQKSGPATIEVYDISLNDFADLIKL